MDNALTLLREEIREARRDDRALATQRSTEVLTRFSSQDARLLSIDTKLTQQNGRVTENEKQVQSLWHHLYQPKAAPASAHDGQVAFDVVNVDRLKWYGLLVAGTVAATLGFLRLIGKI